MANLVTSIIADAIPANSARAIPASLANLTGANSASLVNAISTGAAGAIPAIPTNLANLTGAIPTSLANLAGPISTGVASAIPAISTGPDDARESIIVSGQGFGTSNDHDEDDNNDSFLTFYNHVINLIYYFNINIYAPPELVNLHNSRIFLNVSMLYAIDYIYKYHVKPLNYKIVNEIKENLRIYKGVLEEKTKILSKDYLDIVHDAVEDIKLGDERNSQKQRDNEKMKNETNIANDKRTFDYIKLLVDNSSGFSGGLFTTITSAIANIWKVMMIWSKPFAGLVILVGFIAFIILIFFGEDDSSSSENSGAGTRSAVGPSNFSFFSTNMQGGANNNNTDIISVLQRLPQNMYSFFDKLSMAYTKFSNYANSSSDFMNSLSDTTPVITTRPEKTDPAIGLHDNIYTFDYNYIKAIKTKYKSDNEDIIANIVEVNTQITRININDNKKGRYYRTPTITIDKPDGEGSVQAKATVILKTDAITNTSPPLYEIDRIDIINGGSNYVSFDIKKIKIDDTFYIDDNISTSDGNNLVYNIKMPNKSNNPNISEYYGISHNYKIDKLAEKNEYIYAPKCEKNNYVYEDCTVKIMDCVGAKEEDTSDYKNIII